MLNPQDLSKNENKYQVKANIQHLIKILTEHASLDPCTPIREYISNAHDASLNVDNPRITVWGEGDKLLIKDNGVGMTKEVIIDAFTTIAGHLSQADEKESVGMFGIGVLSAFMVAEKLEVQTRSIHEENGWLLSWERNQPSFSLYPFKKEEHGTVAILHLEDESIELARAEVLQSYIKKTFALFSMPIFIGKHNTAVNSQNSALLNLNVQPGEFKLIDNPEVYKLMRMATNSDLRAIYYAHQMDGARIFLGIPFKEYNPIDLHKVIFFSKGVLVHGNTRDFFPKSLSFVVGLIDHPAFHLQLTRESLFIQDQSFKKIKSNIESHILQFLDLLAKEDRNSIVEILHTHRSMLIAHAQKSKKLRELLKKYYSFTTSAGEIRWSGIQSYVNIENGQKTIYVSSLDIEAYQDLLVTGSPKGFLTVYVSSDERIILKQIADSENVIIKDTAEIDPDEEIEVPVPFRILANKLNGYFLRKGINAVNFINEPDKKEFPTIFRIRNNQGKLMVSSYEGKQSQSTLSIDALMLNVANPLIRSLAGKKHLTKPMLNEVSEGLYQIAVLNSPFVNLLISNNKSITENLVKLLHNTIGTKNSTKLDNGKIKCFVALPYNKEFDIVWRSIKETLTNPPYYWEIVRGDENIHDEILLNGIRKHLKTSHRLIADISGLNPNVLIELGLMLSDETDSSNLLILCDEETHMRLPADLKGIILAIYSKKDKAELENMANWLREKINTFKEFIAITGIR